MCYGHCLLSFHILASSPSQSLVLSALFQPIREPVIALGVPPGVREGMFSSENKGVEGGSLLITTRM